MAPRDRIIMIKRATPKRVTLPDGRIFLARYRRATRDDLPPNITFPRIYKERAAPKGKRRRRRVISYRERQREALRRRAHAQRGRGLGSVLKKAYKLGKRAFNSRLGRKITKAVVSEIPDLLENLGGRVKNKKIKKKLTSDLAKTGADYATSLALEKLQ